MLKTEVVQWLMRAAMALRSHGETELAEQADSLLLADAEHRTAVAKAARERAEAGSGGGRPARAYAIEVQPAGRITYVKGAKRAHEVYRDELEALEPGRFVPTYNSFAVMLSRAQGCSTFVETDNGRVDVLARRCNEYELARLAETESGTAPA